MYTRNRAIRTLLSLILCCALLSVYAPAARATVLSSAPMRSGNAQNGMVRVCLSSLGNPSSLNLTVYGSYTVNGKSSRSISSGSSVKVGFNSATGALTLTVNGSTTNMGTAFKLRRHETSGQNGIKIAQGRVPGNLYPGDFSFVSRSASGGYRLYVIAYIYMEDYLYGVLPYEMGNSSGLEALKAQAVAARTYTMRAMSAASSSLYDVVDTTSDQVYSGTPSGNANCKAAVDATKGIVAKNGSSFTATYYTASNGGQIESIKNAWNSNSYSYLKVKDDPYDLANPDSRKKSFTVSASGTQSNAVLSGLLGFKAASKFGSGVSVTGVTAITPHTPKYASPSRLYTKLDFTVTYTRNGQSGSGTLTFDIFSELEAPLGMSINSGSNELWSVEKNGSSFTVTARRYGHGIGMSQRGAMYMAQLGYTYDQILAFYFEGCERVQYTLNRSILSPVVEGQDSQEQIIPEDPAELDPAQSGTAVIKLPNSGGTATLRTGIEAGASAIVQIPNGATVKVYAAAGDSCLVGYGSLCGYIPRAYLSINGDIPSSTTAVPTRLAGHGTVKNTSALNLRSAPNMSSTVLTTIPKGEVLPLLEIGAEWSKTQYGLRVGYVSNDYLQISGSGSSVEEPTGNGATLTAQTTLRLTASTSGYVITNLAAGTEVARLASDGTWAMIRHNKQTGYVLASLLSATGRDTAHAADDSAASNESMARVTSSSTLNFRTAPNTDATIMAELPTGTTLIVESHGSIWSTVRYHGVRGFVMTEFIDLTTLPIVPTPIPGETQSGLLQARVTTAKGSLNLRATPSDNAKVLRTIPQYETISILERSGGWCKTTYGGYTGYVMTKFLTFLATGATASPTPPLPITDPPSASTPLYARVTTAHGSLNLRATATENGRVLRTIPQYEVITILERGSTWCKTTYGGYTGFVMSSFLTFLSSEPIVSPTPTPALPSAGGDQTLYARVTTVQGSLNLRATANKNGTVLRTIPQYEIIPIYERGSVWCRTLYGGYSGYVMTSFLTFVSQPAAVPSLTPTAAPVSTDPPAAEASYARVTTVKGSLNLRELPRDNAKVLRTIPQYEVVTVLQKGGDWCQVTYGGYTGYVMAQFLTFVAAPGTTKMPAPTPTSAPSQAPAGETVYARVNTPQGSLNLRALPDGDAQILRSIPQYEIVIVLEWGSSWSKVVYSGSTGYVMTQYLSTSLDVPAVTPTPRPATGGNASLTARVTTVKGSLNLRASSNDNAQVLCTIPQYAVIPVYSRGSVWCQVSYNGFSGFVKTEFLTFLDGGSTTGGSSVQTGGAQQPDYNAWRDETLKTLQNAILGQVMPQSGSSVNLRAGCSTNASELDRMPKYDFVVITAVGDTWCAVQYEGKNGYCLREFLEFELHE